MAHYFFDISSGGGFHRDEAGEELDSFDEARDQCQALLADMIREELPNGDRHSVVCDVRAEMGRIVYRGELTFQGTRNPV